MNDTEELWNQAGMMESFLSEATLLSDEQVTWRGRPARLLVVRPTPFERRDGEPRPFGAQARIWLDECGVPLAMEVRGRDGRKVASVQ